MIKNKKELKELVILTFKYDNEFNNGFIKYRDWAKKINNIIDNFEHVITRSIFTSLCKDKIFEKKKLKKKILYLFNPYGKVWTDPYDNYDGIISFE